MGRDTMGEVNMDRRAEDAFDELFEMPDGEEETADLYDRLPGWVGIQDAEDRVTLFGDVPKTRVKMYLNESEVNALQVITQTDLITPGDLLRRLFREEAQRRGFPIRTDLEQLSTMREDREVYARGFWLKSKMGYTQGWLDGLMDGFDTEKLRREEEE